MIMKTLRRASACFALFSSVIFASVSADTLALNPTADAFIRASQNASQTLNTTNVVFLVGDTTTATDYMRGLLTFDFSSPLLAGATINSVTLTLKINSVDATSANQAVNINVYSLTGTFSEGTVTWANRSSSGTSTWTTAGGDYTTLLASTSANAATVTVNQSVAFAGTNLTSLVSNSIGSSASVLLKLDTEDTSLRNIFRFGSVNGTSTLVPVLTIDYTPSAVPEPSTYALLGGVAVLGFVWFRRRSR